MTDALADHARTRAGRWHPARKSAPEASEFATLQGAETTITAPDAPGVESGLSRCDDGREER